jgi:hypothetical protein
MTDAQAKSLTADECVECAEALSKRAYSFPLGSGRDRLLMLADCFRELATMKRMLHRHVN